ncbi:MAG: bifunctional nuclease family protein [Nitrospirae bacterium]|nr:bifunctional nuclease family protein [Nitrospirota bacterium]
MFLQMKVAGIAVDPFAGLPIVILKDLEDKQAVPIWIGLFEASAIATEMEKVKPPRPITHDLLRNVLQALGTKVTRIEVTDLKEDTFFAVIYLQSAQGEQFSIDSRPSDAIALALRTEAPIFVAKDVVERSQKIDVQQSRAVDFTPASKDKWAEILEKMKPEDFGKYKM